MTDRLVLGTAQLGMPYGINNKAGKPDFDRARDIVKVAFDNGITRFDTAQAYGDSEEVLGAVFNTLGVTASVRVYSKLDPKMDLRNDSMVRHSVDGSLQRLGVDHLEGLFLHSEDGLDLWDDGLHATLDGLVRQGKIRASGVSFYTPEKAMRALDLEGVDLLQVPANILDRRFESHGFFFKARDRKKVIFVRSVFLQGLLLMSAESIHASMNAGKEYVRKFTELASNLGVSRQELALGYVKYRYPECFVVVGAEAVDQVAETTTAFQRARNIDIPVSNFERIPESILNPSMW